MAATVILKSSDDISSWTVMQIKQKLDGRYLGDIVIQNCYNHSILISRMATVVTILKLFKRHLLKNCKLDWAETWWEASERHRDSELLKLFCSSIQDGCHEGHLENLQMTYALEWYVRLSQSLVGGIGETWRFRIAKIVLFRYPRWVSSWNLQTTSPSER